MVVDKAQKVKSAAGAKNIKKAHQLNQRPIRVNGVLYPSLKRAYEATGISTSRLVRERIRQDSNDVRIFIG